LRSISSSRGTWFNEVLSIGPLTAVALGVDAGAVVPVVGVACLGDGVSEVAFDLGDCGVVEPLGGDAVCGGPGESGADVLPEAVAVAAGDRRVKASGD
jgi:hypothetical protein